MSIKKIEETSPLYQSAMSNLGAALRETVLGDKLRLPPTPKVWEKVQKDNAELRALLEECRDFAEKIENLLLAFNKADEGSPIIAAIASHKAKLNAKLEEK